MVTENKILEFKLRFNTMHGNTDLYWRVIIGEEEHLVASIQCEVPTYSDASFDKKANTIKYHMAGKCNEFIIDETGKGILR